MAWTSGTATNYLDLLDRFVNFATTEATLVASGQNWSVLRNTWNDNVSTYTGRIAWGTTTNGVTVLDAMPAAFGGRTTYMVGFIEGTLTVPTTGDYTFGIDGDECLDFLLDGNLVAAWYGSHAVSGSYSRTQVLTLTAGTYKFRIRFLQGSGDVALSLGWKKPLDSSIEAIPAGSLSDMQLVWYPYGSTVPTNTAGMDALFGNKHYVLKAPGMSGTDEIFVAITPFANVTGDYYNWEIRGAVGYDANANSSAQPYTSGAKYIYLWNDPIPYWFIVNGNRAIVVAKISNVYHTAYFGKYLSYFLPTQYPYPVLIAGSGSSGGGRWSSANYNYSSILNPGQWGSCMYYVDGTWKEVCNRYEQNGSALAYTDQVNVWPTGVLPNNVLGNSLTWTDGGYTLLPLILNMEKPVKNVLGEVDGIFWVSGHQNASENVINVGGQDYLVVQDIHKTNRADYMAVRLL